MGSVGCEDLKGTIVVVMLCLGVVMGAILLMLCVSTITGHRHQRKRLKRSTRPKTGSTPLSRRRFR